LQRIIVVRGAGAVRLRLRQPGSAALPPLPRLDALLPRRRRPAGARPPCRRARDSVMMRSGWNPTRRNRNIGTARAGHGQDNRLVIPSSRRDPRPYWSRLGPHTTVTRTVVGRVVTILVEPVRESSVHACTVDDLCGLLEQVPGGDWRWSLEFFILRQPKRKEETLRSAWGRLAYGLEGGSYRGPAGILEALGLPPTKRWTH